MKVNAPIYVVNKLLKCFISPLSSTFHTASTLQKCLEAIKFVFQRNYTAVSDIQMAVDARVNITRAGLEAQNDRKAKLQLLIQLPQSLKPEVHVKLDLSHIFPPSVCVVLNKRKHVCQTAMNGTDAVIVD